MSRDNVQNMSNPTNEVLAAKIDALGISLEKVELKMDNLGSKYVSSDIYNLRHAEVEKDILAIKADIIGLQNKKTFINWLLPTLSAILASVVTWLIIEVLSK
jgi:dynactin complex subunit